MIDFPASPTNGQVFTSGAQSWTWDGTKWVASGIAVMPPLSTGDNRIINGDMRIDQRNNGASGTAAGYTVDRWLYNVSQANKGTWGRNLNAVSPPAGFLYYLGFQSSSAYVPAAADFFFFAQIIEVEAVSDFQFGTANAQLVTLSFLAYSSVTGTFSGVIANNALNRSYPFIYTVPTANSWTKIAITIPGDIAGNWTGTFGNVEVIFNLGCGSTYSGPANAWAAVRQFAATGSVNLVSTNGATFYVTGVKLEIGSVATPFNRQSLAKSMADCQRYYQQPTQWFFNGYAAAASQNFYNTFVFNTVMRALPTVTTPSPTYLNASGLTTNTIGVDMVIMKATATAVGNAQASALQVQLSAEL